MTAYGEFKPELAPEVIVERLPVGSAPPVARFTGGEVKTDGVSHHMVNWDTNVPGWLNSPGSLSVPKTWSRLVPEYDRQQELVIFGS